MKPSGSAGSMAGRIILRALNAGFMESYVAGRIPTAKLLDEAWIACQAAEKDALRVGLLQQVREPEQAQSGAPDLDALQDDEIDRLYHGTLRKIAADSRKSIV